MTIYETIKVAISVKQAAEHYGLKVNRVPIFPHASSINLSEGVKLIFVIALFFYC